MFPTQPWRERKDQVSQDSKAERKRRQKLARRDQEKRRKLNERDADADEPEEPEEPEAPAAAAATGFEEDAPVTGGSSSSSSRRIQELEYELDVRTRAAKADSLILQRRAEDAELRFLTQKAMASDESSRRKKLEMASAAQGRAGSGKVPTTSARG